LARTQTDANAKARRELRWQPQYPTGRQGLAAAIGQRRDPWTGPKHGGL